MCRPRCRGVTGFCSSGYCTVIGFDPIFRSVKGRPWTSSLIPLACPSRLGPHRDDRAGHDDVDEPDGKEHLPPEVHQPVVTQSGERPANPDHHEEQHRDLPEEPDRPGNPVEGMERWEREGAAPEQGWW